MELVIFTDNEEVQKNNKDFVFKSLDDMDNVSFVNIHYASGNRYCLDRQHNAWLTFVHDNRALATLSFKIDGVKDLYHGCPSWVDYISVHPDYKCMGLGTKLVEALFAFCHNAGIHWFLQSSYTKEGFHYIKNVFQRVSLDYPYITFTDSESWPMDMLEEEEEMMEE